jgi:hypothetical protein
VRESSLAPDLAGILSRDRRDRMGIRPRRNEKGFSFEREGNEKGFTFQRARSEALRLGGSLALPPKGALPEPCIAIRRTGRTNR